MSNKIIQYDVQQLQCDKNFSLATFFVSVFSIRPTTTRYALLFVIIIIVCTLKNNVQCQEEKNNNNNSTTKDDDASSSIDCNDFRKLVVTTNSGGGLFVDKTSMIEEFIQRADKISRIVRPRGWGKTVNLDMLKTFLQIEIDETGKPLQKAKRKNFKLFAGGTIDLGFDKKQQLKPLKIAESKFAIEHQGKYPVVWVSFENITGTNATEILTDLKKLISDLYDRHGYLNANVPAGTENNFTIFRDATYTNDSQVTEGLETLIKLMYAHFNQKVYVFIDDYDKPVTNALAALYDVYKTDQCTYPDWIIFAKVAKSKRFRQIRRLFKLLLSKTLEENTAVQQAVITGVYYLSFFDRSA